MIEINLLPSGGATRRPGAAARLPKGASLPRVGGDPRLAAAGGGVLLLVILAGFLVWQSGNRVTALEAQVDGEVRDSTRLAQTIELMESLDARRDTIEEKIGVIRSVDGRRYVWAHLLDEIARATPQLTWLTKVAAVEGAEIDVPVTRPAAGDSAAGDSARRAPPGPPPGPVFTLEGNAGSTQALTRFMKDLEASPMIRDVALVTSEQTETEGRVYLKFTLEARFEEPDPALIQTVPVVTLR